MEPLSLPLARSSIDRAAHHREEADQLWASSYFIHLSREGFLTKDNQLILLSHSEIPIDLPGEKFFLGEDEQGTYFVWCSLDPLEGLGDYQTLRAIGDLLDSRQIGLAVHAQGLTEWHHRTPFCGLCGTPNHPALSGAVRRCEGANHESYPRTDPAIIVLIRDAQNRILLGRQKVWPEHRYSTFAGFVETGESFEQALIREVFEEASIEVSDIKYLGSQPWPFPQSLMIAFEAIATNPESARPDGEEIVDVRWFSKREFDQAVSDGTLLLPPAMSVSRAMIDAWHGTQK